MEDLATKKAECLRRAAAARSAANEAIRQAQLVVTGTRTGRDQRADGRARHPLVVESLRTALRKAEEGNLARDEFLAVVAHEMRQPLQAAGLAHEIIRRALSDYDSKALESLDIAERQVQRLERLVDDVLNIALTSLEKLQLFVEPVDLAAVMERAADDVRHELEKHGHRLEFRPLPGGVSIAGDSFRLGQVFTNLLENAIRYTPDGGTIWFEGRCETEQARITVRDTGPGINSEDRAGIFELFVRRSRRPGGAGIGLAVVNALVKRHGGTIELASPHEGAEFVLRFPLRSGVGPNAPAPSEPEHAAG